MDELDLIKCLQDAPPLRPEAYERARATLATAMATPGRPEVVAVVAAPARKKWFTRTRVGVGVLGVAAAAAAAVSVISAPTAPAPAGSAAQQPVAEARLVTLAADVKASGGALPGDASLVVMTTTAPDGKPHVTYNLYSDKGEIFFAEDKGTLAAAVGRGDNLAESSNASVIAAARFAAGNDLAQARVRMINAASDRWGIGLGPAEAQQAWDRAEAELMPILKQKGITSPRPRPTGKALEDGINSTLWNNSESALIAGAANPEVRAGVLRLMATIPDVTVTNTTVDGQPALDLTAGRALFAGHSDYVLTINARTGLPIRSETTHTAPGEKPSPGATYQSSRVQVADIAAGRF